MKVKVKCWWDRWPPSMHDGEIDDGILMIYGAIGMKAWQVIR